jgi:hypothetical protein
MGSWGDAIILIGRTTIQSVMVDASRRNAYGSGSNRSCRSTAPRKISNNASSTVTTHLSLHRSIRCIATSARNGFDFLLTLLLLDRTNIPMRCKFWQNCSLLAGLLPRPEDAPYRCVPWCLIISTFGMSSVQSVFITVRFRQKQNAFLVIC